MLDDIDCSDSTLCFGLIGAGGSFCVRKNCRTSSHALSKWPLAGTTGTYLFIGRSVPGTVFSQPFLSLDKIPQGVREDWSSMSTTLPEWTLKFRTVDNTNNSSATEEVIKEETLFLSKAELLKTPAKRTRDPDDDVILGAWQGPTLERTLPSPGEDLEAFIDIGVSKDRLIKAVASVESNVAVMNDGVKELASLTHNRFINAELNVDTLMGIIQSLKSRDGDAVDVEERFLAPTLWGTTSIIADEVVDLQNALNRFYKATVPLTDEMVKKVDVLSDEGAETQRKFTMVVGVVSGLVEKVQEIMKSVTEVKEEVANAAKVNSTPPRTAVDHLFGMMNSRMSQDGTGGGHLFEGKANPPVVTGGSVLNSDPEYTQLLADVKALKISANDAQAIKFAGLELRDFKDAAKWVERNLPSLRYGLIVDPLLMLERIYGDDEVDSGSSLKTMETRLKLKIGTGAEASALNALKHARLRIFHKGRPNMVNLPDKSRLNLLASYKDWRSGGEGVEHFITTKMNVLYSSISSEISNELGGDPETHTAHLVATKYLTATVAFITQLIGTVNSIYERLFTFSKFTTEQAWSLATQVLDRVVADLYVPKDGVIEALVTGCPVSTCAHIVWAAFRTHETMQVYLDHQIENHPAISTEYVKFLATNSGSDKVVKLTLVVEGL